MSTLLDGYLWAIHRLADAADWAIDGLGMGGGAVDRLVAWLGYEADLVLASLLAAVVLAAWAMTTGGLASWLDRRVRARVEGRRGPRVRGPGGSLQGLVDWLKLMLRKREGAPSAAPAALSASLVLAALAIVPLGPWGKLADPEWGLPVAAVLVALSALPLAAMEVRGRRLAAAAEAAGVGSVLVLSIASVVLAARGGSAEAVVEAQAGGRWGLVISPLGFLLLMVALHWESSRLERGRRTGASREEWPGPHRALARYALAVRYYAVAVMGAVAFLGGWEGPGPDGLWWTLLKAFALVALASAFAAATPAATAASVARAARARWLPLATLNLVVVAVILEVMA